MIPQPISCLNHANVVALVGSVVNGLVVELYKLAAINFAVHQMHSIIQQHKNK
jgi:hypothetical protein